MRLFGEYAPAKGISACCKAFDLKCPGRPNISTVRTPIRVCKFINLKNCVNIAFCTFTMSIKSFAAPKIRTDGRNGITTWVQFLFCSSLRNILLTVSTQERKIKML